MKERPSYEGALTGAPTSSPRAMYEVSKHGHGRRQVTRDGPAQGLLDWPRHTWVKVTPRPVGLARAIREADSQTTHATVCEWGTATVVYDNGKTPVVPSGQWHPEARTALDRRRAFDSVPS